MARYSDRFTSSGEVAVTETYQMYMKYTKINYLDERENRKHPEALQQTENQKGIIQNVEVMSSIEGSAHF